MMRRPVMAAALFGAAMATPAPARVDDQRTFRVTATIQPVAGASVQRLALPGDILTALQRADLGDLRVFDRTGKAVPIARIDPASLPSENRRVALRAYPILGSPGGLKTIGVSIKLAGDKIARVVSVDDRPEQTGSSLLGVLLDTRDVAEPGLGLSLDADLPQSQPVRFTIEASADLADWEKVAHKVIYRAADRSVTAETIALDHLDLRGRYLRVTWSAASRLLSPVTIRGATLITPGAAARDIVVAATAPPLTDPYRVEFSLPFAARLAALRIVPPVGTFVIPVKLFGRADREQPWALLGEGTVFQVIKDGRAQTNGGIALPDGAFRELKIEADRRSGGFPAAPGLELHFAVQQVAALLAGKPPFTLAAGSATAPNVYLPLQTLVPDGRAETVPLAAVTAPRGGKAAVTLPSSQQDRASLRTILLWGALIVGTLSLAAIAWSLYRGVRRQAPPDAGS